MEGRVYEAAVEGNVNSLVQLLREDALLLDRFITGFDSETPLHIASMLGHDQFVQEILNRKAELAKVLDARKASPLHLATAKGYLEIVKKLLQASPDMCFVRDRDGRNPVHIAALKGHVSILGEIVQARPGAARVLMDRGETILHACARHNQLDAMKFLLERISDHEFVNLKNYDGNTVLHIAVADKQQEAVIYLVANGIEVNSMNKDGLTVLDLLSKNERDVKDIEVAESLRRVGAVNGKVIPLPKNELEVMRKQILSSVSSNQHDARQRKKKHKKVVNKHVDWLERKKNSLMVVASLIATMAFQACLTPPGSFWQDSSNGHEAGYSVLADQKPEKYSYFLSYNTTGLVASLSIILLLMSGLPLRHRVFMWFLMVIMWIAITAMAMTYLVAITAYTPERESVALLRVIEISLLIWVGLMVILLLGHTIRLIIRLIRYICKKLRGRRPSSTQMV
ncbi:hypothetical protein SLEP1_g13909 [Rubroshorea leprosula]|uniref:PGG domain-containing protein n=1 Tax=Rubroshorea leprosula TaxID=152421 RepID=A0AAV5IQD1_9ROSI|nr:hypothetical protein SLEP1_g13909 [Rubroshorea leprosula]